MSFLIRRNGLTVEGDVFIRKRGRLKEGQREARIKGDNERTSGRKREIETVLKFSFKTWGYVKC